MPRFFPRSLALILATFAVVGAHADQILQGQWSGALAIATYKPVAQSFLAQDAQVNFGFNFFELNPSSPNAPIQLQILGGDGLGGPVLGTFAFTLPVGYAGFFDVDISSIALTPGLSYTASVSTLDFFVRWAVRYTSSNAYADGKGYVAPAQAQTVPLGDFSFRVTPVPELGTASYSALGFAVFIWLRRKRREQIVGL